MKLGDKVLKALEEFGPMTRAEICEFLGLDRGCYGSLVSRLHAKKLVHIKQYISVMEGRRNYPRAVYAYGPGKNAKKPPPKERNAVVREYVARRINKFRASSVFNMGLQVKDIKQRLRGST